MCSFVQQHDSYNCGPNAVLKIMSVFDRIPQDTVVEMLDPGDVRRITICDFRSLLRDFSGSFLKGISVRVPTKRKQIQAEVEETLQEIFVPKPSAKESVEETLQEIFVPEPSKKESVEEALSQKVATEKTVDDVRKDAIMVRSAFRSQQRRRMRKQRENDVTARCANVGDCVNMELDKRDIPHARGLVGVVFNVGNGGGAQVVTRA